MATKMIKLKSAEPNPVILEVEVEVATKSKMIKDMLEHVDDKEDVTIPLPQVDATTLKKVIEWASHHKDDPDSTDEEEETKEMRRTADIPPWDVNFLQVDTETLFGIILAATYLDIKGLLDVASKTVANMIKDKTVEQMRQILNIKNHFTPEEEEQIRKENERLHQM